MKLAENIDLSNIPVHAAIIMDGNGRWAQNKKLPRTAGHKEGLETAKKIIKAARAIGIQYLTLYTFSTENWKRTSDEVGFLMNLVATHLRAEFEFYKKNGVRLMHIGRMEGLPSNVQKEITDAVNDCKDFTDITVVLAINYGGRDEIMRAVKRMISESSYDKTAEADEKHFSRFLDMPELPDVDLLIRTGGDTRISNFLLWQSAYAELSFSHVLWPDYSEEDFYKAVIDYQKRDRRFGGVLKG